VDLNWAKEHHSLWLDEQNARTGVNETRRQPSVTSAE
jgi:formate dehydrogenase subunit gamma